MIADAPELVFTLIGPEAVTSSLATLRAGNAVVVLIPAVASVPHLAPPLESERQAADKRADGTVFLIRRQLVRAIAQAVSGLAPEALGIATGLHGAPRFENVPDLHISFSARKGHSLIGIANMPIGVDLEQEISSETFPWNVMRPEEASALRALSEARQADAFLSFWTRKEAVLKALGSGFSIPPEHLYLMDDRQFSVQAPETSVTQAGTVRLREARWQDQAMRKYGIAVALLPPYTG